MTNRFRQQQEQYNSSIIIDLPFATKALQNTYNTHTTLFSQRNHRHDALMEVFDKINKQYGQNTVRLGAQGKRM